VKAILKCRPRQRKTLFPAVQEAKELVAKLHELLASAMVKKISNDQVPPRLWYLVTAHTHTHSKTLVLPLVG
jgi:hypothetical protein